MIRRFLIIAAGLLAAALAGPLWYLVAAALAVWFACEVLRAAEIEPERAEPLEPRPILERDRFRAWRFLSGFGVWR